MDEIQYSDEEIEQISKEVLLFNSNPYIFNDDELLINNIMTDTDIIISSLNVLNETDNRLLFNLITLYSKHYRKWKINYLQYQVDITNNQKVMFDFHMCKYQLSELQKLINDLL